MNTENRIKLAPDVYQYALDGDFYQGLVSAELTHKRQLLGQFFTNLDGRVTALTNRMPSRLAAAVTARLSRAQIQDIRELFWQEFVQDPDLGLGGLLSNASQEDPIEGLLRGDKAAKMITRIVDKFGDDSVREQASGYIMIQDGSVLASMDAFNRGILMTGIEGSTRYIPYFSKDENGHYRYVDAPDSFSPDEKVKYQAQMERAFDLYSGLWPKVWSHVEKTNPRDPKVSEDAYRVAVLGKVCDLLRGLLPLGIKTNFAVHGNYRNLTELIVSLRSSPLQESRDMADLMAAETMKVSPEFVQMVDSGHGRASEKYLQDADQIQMNFIRDLNIPNGDTLEPSVRIKISNQDYLTDILAAMASIHQPSVDPDYLAEAIDANVSTQDVQGLMKNLKEARGNRRHKLPAAFSAALVGVSMDNISIGAMKDFNRHRAVLCKSRLQIDVDRGAHVPEELKDVDGTGEIYSACKELQAQAMKTFFELRDRHPSEAHLVLTHGTLGTMQLLMHAGEAFWISEIRSMASGNPEYRWFAQQIYAKLLESMPELSDLGSYVDQTPTYALGRIGEAVRADLKGRST